MLCYVLDFHTSKDNIGFSILCYTSPAACPATYNATLVLTQNLNCKNFMSLDARRAIMEILKTYQIELESISTSQIAYCMRAVDLNMKYNEIFNYPKRQHCNNNN